MANNKFFVGVGGNDIIFMRPIPQKISKSDAIELAAWIVCLADDNMGKEGGQFKTALNDVMNT